jgi:hypothetical protein
MIETYGVWTQGGEEGVEVGRGGRGCGRERERQREQGVGERWRREGVGGGQGAHTAAGGRYLGGLNMRLEEVGCSRGEGRFQRKASW